jgi:hypothetical protein
MAQATVQTMPVVPMNMQQVNCASCLTRGCPMAGDSTSPVQACNTYRKANCYLCNQTNCALVGTLDAPVMMCDRFEMIAMA